MGGVENRNFYTSMTLPSTILVPCKDLHPILKIEFLVFPTILDDLLLVNIFRNKLNTELIFYKRLFYHIFIPLLDYSSLQEYVNMTGNDKKVSDIPRTADFAVLCCLYCTELLRNSSSKVIRKLVLHKNL